MKFLEDIGANIRSERERIGMTQVDLGEKIGSVKQFVYRIEKGKTNISIVTLAKIAQALDVDLYVLIRSENAKSAQNK